jgi:hypothetical protein
MQQIPIENLIEQLKREFGTEMVYTFICALEIAQNNWTDEHTVRYGTRVRDIINSITGLRKG